jgi:hypothetical protein
MRWFPRTRGVVPKDRSALGLPTRFPRTRGVVPSGPSLTVVLRQVSPHARGCTRPVHPSFSVHGGFPAPAGLYLHPQPGSPQPGRFPRTRGVVPQRDMGRTLVLKVSPHTRGCSLCASDRSASRPRVCGVVPIGSDAEQARFPAPAGLYRLRGGRRGSARRFPRTRGVVPVSWDLSSGSEGVPRICGVVPAYRELRTYRSPHARGCTCDCSVMSRPRSGFPARAGLYRAGRRGVPSATGFPRTRGVVPECSASSDVHPLGSPHTRGCTQRSASTRRS